MSDEVLGAFIAAVCVTVLGVVAIIAFEEGKKSVVADCREYGAYVGDWRGSRERITCSVEPTSAPHRAEGEK